MNHKIHFSGQLMGIRSTDKNLPVDFDNKIMIYGGTPFKFVESILWTFHVTGIATPEEFAQSPLSESHQDVSFDYESFITNCYKEFRLTEDCDQYYKAIYPLIRRSASEITEQWSGHAEVFLHLYGLEHAVNYSIHRPYQNEVELKYLASLGEYIKEVMNKPADAMTMKAYKQAVVRIGQYLELELNATVEGVLQYINAVISNPESATIDTAFVSGIRHIKGNSNFASHITQAFYDDMRDAKDKQLNSMFETDKEIVVEAIKQRVNDWRKAA